MTISAHDATRTVDCVANGCENVATHNIGSKGPYADLCDEHYEEQRKRFSDLLSAPRERRERRQDEQLAQNGPLPARESRSEPSSGSLKEAAQALVGPAARVDQARRRKEAVNGEYDSARGALASAVEDFKVALQTLG